MFIASFCEFLLDGLSDNEFIKAQPVTLRVTVWGQSSLRSAIELGLEFNLNFIIFSIRYVWVREIFLENKIVFFFIQNIRSK